MSSPDSLSISRSLEEIGRSMRQLSEAGRLSGASVAAFRQELEALLDDVIASMDEDERGAYFARLRMGPTARPLETAAGMLEERRERELRERVRKSRS